MKNAPTAFPVLAFPDVAAGVSPSILDTVAATYTIGVYSHRPIKKHENMSTNPVAINVINSNEVIVPYGERPLR